ncbi:CinA family nicotinamide mononucleotide deamidase-related protein [candidate division WOR-3 bacterium]|nr:CinA family nicotinamide mononucleotide deamidase-related protein [candidate division WOR-3 bacterium]
MKKAEIILVGDELVDGRKADVNGVFIASELTSCGYSVGKITFCPDEKNSIIAALEKCGKDTDVIFIAGGLGPTNDDLTRFAASDFFARKLALDGKALDHIKGIFESKGRQMNPANEIQAEIPEGSEIWINPEGTACSFSVEENMKIYVFLPGVPHEVQALFREHFKRYLERRSGEKPKKSIVFRTFGIPESDLFGVLSKKTRIFEFSKVSFLPQESGIDLRIEEKNGEDNLISARDEIVKTAGEWIWSEDGNNIEEIVACLLRKFSLTISVAESCTGGYISNMLTDVPGSSEYFKMSIVSYSDRSKNEILGVDPLIIQKHGSVSPVTAEKMAQNIRKISGSDIGMSSTGIAGPTGATAEKPVGLLYVSISSEKYKQTERYIGFGGRKKNKISFSFFALNLLRRFLQNNYDEKKA